MAPSDDHIEMARAALSVMRDAKLNARGSTEDIKSNKGRGLGMHGHEGLSNDNHKDEAQDNDIDTEHGHEGVSNDDHKDEVQDNDIDADHGLGHAAASLADLNSRIADIRRQSLPDTDSSSGYLGKTKLSVNALFFSGEADGMVLSSEVDTPETFTMIGRKISTGRRLYVNKQMKHFLSAPILEINHGQGRALALVPYHPKYAHKSASYYLSGKSYEGRTAITRRPIHELDYDLVLRARASRRLRPKRIATPVKPKVVHRRPKDIPDEEVA